MSCTVKDAPALGLAELDGERLGLLELDGLRLGEVDGETDGLTEGDTLGETDGETEGETDGLTDEDGVRFVKISQDIAPSSWFVPPVQVMGGVWILACRVSGVATIVVCD